MVDTHCESKRNLIQHSKVLILSTTKVLAFSEFDNMVNTIKQGH